LSEVLTKLSTILGPVEKIVVHAEADSCSTNNDIEIKSLYDLMVELKAK
jgi:hypothetical protein